MHHEVFSKKNLDHAKLKQYAETIGLDMSEFEECFDSGKHAAEIRKDMAEGRKASARGTPTFLLGLTNPDDSKLKATKILRGAQPYSQFKEAIDSLLSSQK